ncbi:hypothetical protein [Arthrobacter sp. MWB30]|jgi:hypothetical protein|uniref:hypothetical protein n=1 Tax=Paenarthrobacter sp. C1 TaxID=3400220 RepID=UPI00057C65FA|nr:hypothetical protein ANMWB30_33180 [Arthrobacter sp. MWB30]
MKNRSRKVKVLSVVLGAVVLGTAGIGVANATVQATEQPLPEMSQVTSFAGDAGLDRTAGGQTYGVPEEIKGQTAEPDLIRVYATNGRLGYIRNPERKVATGDPSLFKSPEEALRWQENRVPGHVTIPVYDVDGVTKIGEFEFSAPNPTSNVK